MILAQNPQLPLNGNKYCFFLLGILLLSACSPKVRKPVADQNNTTKKIEKEVEKPASRFTQANISLLVPFRLNEIKLKTASKADVEKAAMAIDFYQGFRLGVDSAAASGLNFKLNVYDTRDSNSQIDELIEDGKLMGSNLIVGPIFPEGLKHIKNYAITKGIPVVSPLAATNPEEFDNPNLISVVSNVNLHAEKLGNYITKHYNSANTVVVLINPKTPGDEVMGNPVKAYFSTSKPQFVFQEYASVFTLETKLIKGKKYVIIVSSSDRNFVTPTIDKLIKMKKVGMDVDLYGHPDWIKQNYSTDKLQALNTAVTSSYKVDYTRTAVKSFVKKYREQFSFEPGEYAFKGFDAGFFFAKLLAEHGPNYLPYLTKEKYKGLHNNFSFYHHEKLGYINTSLMLLRYQNFALNIIE